MIPDDDIGPCCYCGRSAVYTITTAACGPCMAQARTIPVLVDPVTGRYDPRRWNALSRYRFRGRPIDARRIVVANGAVQVWDVDLSAYVAVNDGELVDTEVKP